MNILKISKKVHNLSIIYKKTIKSIQIFHYIQTIITLISIKKKPIKSHKKII
jgi:hypothetical protein